MFGFSKQEKCFESGDGLKADSYSIFWGLGTCGFREKNQFEGVGEIRQYHLG